MRALIVLLGLLIASSARADSEDDWLSGLQERVAQDVVAGKPVVVQAHVPLCSNEIITCGGHGLGDGDDPDRNLYWATSGGFRGFFKANKKWKRVLTQGADGDVLETLVWRRSFKPSKAWKDRGVTDAFDVYLVAYAWRGSAIDDALEAYVTDLFGGAARELTLDDGTVIEAGGAAHIVAYVGHNRWMDRDPYDFAAVDETLEAPAAKGTFAIACLTADYLKEAVPSAERVPLLFTEDYLFAGAFVLEGGVRAFAEGGGYKQIRKAAAKGYADGQGKALGKVIGAFTNPSDKRW